MSLIHYTRCAVCLGKHIHPVLDAKDHTVSESVFSIWHCKDCSFRFTQDIPSIENIGTYYQSTNYISHSNTKKGIVNKLYHLVRNYTLGTKARLLQKVTGLEKGNLLDIGAGTGAFANTMKQKGWNVTALEPDAIARNEAQKNYGLELELPARLFEFGPNSFDAISMWHVIEHVHDLVAYMRQLNKIIRDKGRLIIAVPNYTAADAATYGKYWAAYDVPRHLHHFSPSSMEIMGDLHGFRLVATKAMWFDAYYVAMLSEQYKNGRPHLIRALWQGLKSNFKAISNEKKCSSVIYIFEKKLFIGPIEFQKE
ncbi:MAG: class I SAM-dependent methyltransferase [Sphingobacteriia bacterium]|nr:MAG: class I SAM-dependent methyltransferase [Sphingobacteriia bacterium]